MVFSGNVLWSPEGATRPDWQKKTDVSSGCMTLGEVGRRQGTWRGSVVSRVRLGGAHIVLWDQLIMITRP